MTVLVVRNYHKRLSTVVQHFKGQEKLKPLEPKPSPAHPPHQLNLLYQKLGEPALTPIPKHVCPSGITLRARVPRGG